MQLSTKSEGLIKEALIPKYELFAFNTIKTVILHTMKKPCLLSSFLSGQIFFLLMFFSFSFYGQIQYTDVTPDKLWNKGSEIDMDGDGVIDCSLKFRWTSPFFTNLFEYFIVTDSLVEIAVVNDSAAALYVNEPIDQDLIWSNTDTTYASYDLRQYYHYGQWYYITDHAFLGLRLKKGDNFIYAWIRINVICDYYCGPPLMFISDFAVNTNLNENILAGQGIPSYATSVYGFDGNDFLDARDVSVSFTRAYDESLFSEYRIIVAKADDTTAFDLGVLNQVPEDSYTKVLIDLADSIHNVSLNLDQNKLDKDGDSIKSYQDYKVYLLNVSISEDPSYNLVSTPSTPFYLSSISEPVSQLIAYDDDNSGTSSDIKVEFEKISREEFIHEYRIFIAPYVDMLNLEMALDLSAEHYTTHKPDGSNPVIEINPLQSDINGNSIAENIDYVVYILSVADGTYSKTSAISKPSKRFRLSNPDILTAGQKVGNNLVYVEIDTTLDIKSGDSEHPDTLSFDIDQNGTMDIKFIGEYGYSPSGWEYRYLHAVGLGNTSIMLCDHTNHPDWTAMLYENYQIGEQFSFSNDNTILHEYVSGNWNGDNYSIGHFDPFNVAYVGFCLMDYNQPVYGWIRITRVNGTYYTFDSYAYEIDASSIEDNKHKSYLILYPNPAHDFIYLETLNSYSSGDDIQVKIFDVQGNTIDEFSFNGSSHKHNISGYSKGIYFCTLKIKNNGEETHKFIVH